MVIPFIINITMEINFSSKVYSKSLLNRLHDITCLLLYHLVICYNVYILKDPKNSSISSAQYGRSICFSYSNHFSGFCEVLRKQEVSGGTFPIHVMHELTSALLTYKFGQVWAEYVCHDVTPQLWHDVTP